MAKSDETLDRVFREKLENHQETPSLAAWDTLASQLDTKQAPKKGNAWWAIAAAIPLMLGAAFLFWSTGKETEKQAPLAEAQEINPEVNVNPPGDRPAGVNELRLQLNVVSKEGLKYVSEPGILLEGLNLTSKVDTVKAQNLVLSFNKVIDQEKGILEIGVKESTALTNLITLKVYEFPWINLLWLGVIVTTIGFMMGAYYRFKK